MLKTEEDDAPKLFSKAPEFDGNPLNYPTWSTDFSCHLLLTGVTKEELKKALLYTCLSITVKKTLTALCAPQDVLMVKYDDLQAKLRMHYYTEPIKLAAYHNLFMLRKSSGTTYHELMIKVRSLLATCEWPLTMERAGVLVFTMALEDNKLRSKLLHADTALMDTALQTALQQEMIDKAATIGARPTTSTDFQSVNQIQKSKSSVGGRPCFRCGQTNHQPDNCRFRKERCNACNKEGHISKVCRSKPQQQPPHPSSKFKKRGENKSNYNHYQKNNQVVANLIDIKVSSISGHSDLVDTRRIEVQLQLNGFPTKLEYDTGAAVTVINKNLWFKLGKPLLSQSKVNCRGYNNQAIPLMGEATVDVICNGKKAKLKMLVSQNGDNVMGRSWIHALQLFCECRLKTCIEPLKVSAVSCLATVPNASVDELLSKFTHVFKSGLGHCTKVKAHLSLKQDSHPKFVKARPLPFAVYEAVDKELNRLVDQDVLQAINYSEWAAPVVIAPKPGGQIRLCADFSTGLNASLDLHQYPLPQPDELFSKLNGGQVFSKIDFSEAYLQMELDEESKKLVVINTHKGLFRYNRLPFGVSSAPAIFQQTMEKMLAGVPGVGVYLDDIIVTGTTAAAHLRNLHQVLQRITDYGFRLKKEKCSWAQPSVEYLGFIIDGKGQHTSLKKTKAIADMPPPKNVHQLRSFLGMIQHYAKFVPALSTRLSPLHQLLRKQEGSDNRLVLFKWTSDCQKAFNEIKKDLMSPRMLVHYTPHLPIIMAADASNDGIGAVITHRMPDGQELPIAHASKTLSDREKRYPQIQKEALALIFGIKKFHKYLWGRHFVLQTDHQPLVKIFGSKKGLPTTAANRLQNYAIILMAYSFDIEYVKTDAFGQADGLSRLPSGEDTDFKEAAEIDAELHQVFTERLNEAPVRCEDIARATKEDKVLQKVLLLHKKGWPDHLSAGFDKENLLPFFKIRHELEFSNHCLLWGLRTIIPSLLHQKTLHQLHKTHPGQSTMKRMARKYFWWPQLDKNIEEMVSSCDACNNGLPNPPKILLRPWPIAERPWQRVHIDFAGPFLGSMWFVAVDAHSKWPEITEMKSQKTHTTEVIFALTEMFSRWGICEEIVSDNGPQFTSDEFKRFCFENGIKHTLTPPYHPQSNGQVERFIQTFKNALLKAQTEEGKEERKLQVLQFLQRYRLTPHPTTEEAPAELFIKRTPRSHWDLVYPSAMATMEKNRLRMKEQFDQHKKDKTLFIGAQVLARNFTSKKNRWVKGTIVERLGSVKWKVQVAGQTKLWPRHSNQLRLFNSSRPPPPDLTPCPSMEAMFLPQKNTVEDAGEARPDIPEDNVQFPDASFADNELDDDVVPAAAVVPPVAAAPATFADAQPAPRRSARQPKPTVRFAPSRY